MTDETTEAAPALEPLHIDHKIELEPFGWLSVKYGLLNIVTLTLYRFWGKTEVRRMLWGAIRLNGEPFEYTGRGKELFFGFLIAMGVIVLPFLLLVFGLQFGPEWLLFAFLPLLYIGMFYLFGAGMFLAYRYLASRTTWRGVRFHLEGDPNRFAGFVLIGIVLTGISFGWYAPAFTLKMYEKLWGRLSFGDQKFRWETPANAPGVYGPFALVWLVGVLGYLIFVIAVVLGAIGAAAAGASEEGAMAMVLGLTFLFLPIWLVAVLLATAVYSAAMMRRAAASIRFGEARFALTLRKRDLIWLYVSNYFLIALTLGFLLPLVEARTARFIIRRLTSEGGAPLSAALQAPQGPRTGEGIADAFGFAFV